MRRPRAWPGSRIGAFRLQLLASGRGRRAFYTVPSDHYNCAIGSHTHSIPLPAERAQELEQTLSFMTGIGYIKMEEVPDPSPVCHPGAVVYAPLGDSPVDPDVVLFMGGPGGSCSSRRPRSGPASACPHRFWGGPPAWRCPPR